ncbi:MAG: universal stress protein [Thermoleophilia bacterium]
MPAPYRTIACCIDRDEASARVVEEASALCPPGDHGSLHLIHVLAPPLVLGPGPYAYDARPEETERAAREWLEELAAGLPGAVPVVLAGHPQRVVCSWARENAADLIAAAAHRGVVDRALLGGFASFVAYHAPCPVLLVRPI